MRTIFAILLLAGCAADAKQDADGYVEIFDGKSLEGWSAPDPSYFSVQDGAITGEATPKHLPPYNQFLVWQGGKVKDFDLRFKFRITGAKANSGMQFRSTVKEKGLVWGYQADIAMSGPYLGGIWDEYGPRKSLAARGESVVGPLPRRGALRAGPLGFVDQHDGDIVLDRVDDLAVGVGAVELVAFQAKFAFAEGARHDVEQVFRHRHGAHPLAIRHKL